MPDPVLRFYTAEKLSEHREITPEGYLLVKNAPIARTGSMLYAQGEVPVEADESGIIKIHRDPEEVFAPIAIASFNGKPLTNDHPPMKVDPLSWKEYAVGVVLNPHRGDGALLDSDFLYADLLIQDADAIRDVREGKRELSGGYDAEYQQIRPGEGRQHLIVGNHVALVDRGRCGPQCYIGDNIMAVSQRVASHDAIRASAVRHYRDRLSRAAAVGDTKTIDELVEELQRVPGMLGDVLSGANEQGGFAKIDAPIEAKTTSDNNGMHIHLHNGGGMSMGGDEAEGGAPPSFGGGEDPAPAGGGDLQSILERLEAVERAIAILAQEEGNNEMGEQAPDDPSASDRRTGDRASRARSRDEAPTPPDTDMPDDAPREDTGGPTEEGRLTGDRRKAMVGDSTSLKGSWQELISRAEVLAPGIRMPTFDARASAKTTHDAMCGFRRKVISEALKEDDTRQVIEGIEEGRPDLKQMTCDAVKRLFNAASTMVQTANSKRAVSYDTSGSFYDAANKGLRQSVRDIQAKNEAFWANQQQGVRH
jgi:hypothetical protein